MTPRDRILASLPRLSDEALYILANQADAMASVCDAHRALADLPPTPKARLRPTYELSIVGS